MNSRSRMCPCKDHARRVKSEFARASLNLGDVRFGSNSEVSLLARHIRCTLRSGRRQDVPAGPFRAQTSYGLDLTAFERSHSRAVRNRSLICVAGSAPGANDLAFLGRFRHAVIVPHS